MECRTSQRSILRRAATKAGALALGSLLWLGIGAGAAHAAETTTYMLTDVQGTVIMTEDAHGVTTSQQDYRPYGKPNGSVGPDGPGYTGHVNDPGTGLVYMQARYYDPEVGRFLSVDPVVPQGGKPFTLNRYVYGDNNPIVAIDPDGKAPVGSPFASFRFWNSYIGNGVKHLMTRLALTARHQSSRVEISASGTATYGMGFTVSKGIYNSGDSIGIPVAAGEGLEASIDARYRVFTFNFFENPSNAPVSIVAHASLHVGGGAVGELVYNPGGTLKGYIGSGVGMGESAYVAAMDFDVGGGAGDEDREKEEEWMEEQQIRRDMGIGRDSDGDQYY